MYIFWISMIVCAVLGAMFFSIIHTYDLSQTIKHDNQTIGELRTERDYLEKELTQAKEDLVKCHTAKWVLGICATEGATSTEDVIIVE